MVKKHLTVHKRFKIHELYLSRKPHGEGQYLLFDPDPVHNFEEQYQDLSTVFDCRKLIENDMKPLTLAVPKKFRIAEVGKTSGH